MRARLTGVVILLLMAAAGAAAPAPKAAQRLRQSDLREWWKKPAIAEDLALTEQQRQAIDKLEVDYQTSHEEHARLVRRAQLALLALLGEPTADPKVVEGKREEAMKAWAAYHAAALDRIIALRRLLTAQQWETLSLEAPAVIRTGGVSVRPLKSAGGEAKARP